MQTLRTPDDRFADLPDFPWEPAYAEVPDPATAARSGWRTSTPGPADGPVALLLHGEPSWSFLYRHVIPVLADAGHPRHRARPGRLRPLRQADRPEDHSYARHVEWMRALVFDHLDLRDVTVVGQDWGGLIGLRLVAEHPDRFARVVAANTGLPTGDFDMPEIWWQFRERSRRAEVLDIGRLVAVRLRARP